MNFNPKNRTAYHLVGIFIAAFLITMPVWIYGMPDPEDALRHFQFANSVYDSLREGNLYIQGEPNVNQGYGGVALRFYPPFTYYLLSATYLVTENWYDAAFLFFWLWMAISGIGVYFLAREWISENFAFLAALLYIVDSFHNSQIQLTYAYAEFVAGGLLAYCFLFASRTIRRGNLFDIAGLSISFGLLLLTHIPISIIGSFCLVIFCIASLKRADWKKSLLRLSTAVLIGGLASSFHWIRLITEKEWINHSSAKFLTEGFYNYQNFFVNIRATMFPGDLIFLNFLIFIIPSILILFFKSNSELKRKLFPMAFVTVFSIYMATSFSQPIWENIATLQKIQFPWRWFTITSIGAAVLVAAGMQGLKSILSQRKAVLTFWIALCIVANGYFTVSYIIGSNLIDTSYFLVSRQKFDQEVNQKRTAPYHVFWQTIWAAPSVLKTKDKIEVNERNYEILTWGDFDKEFKISAGTKSEARIAQFYYPYWQAKVNGVNVSISKTDDGAIMIPLPSEEASVHLMFVEPLIVKVFIILSILGWLTIIILFFLSLNKVFRFNHTPAKV